MGNGNGCKREHPRAVVHHHCWPTSISITRWICGSNHGGGTNRRGCDLRTVRGRWCGWLSEEIDCQTVMGGIEATYAEVRPGTACRENASAGIRTICGRATAGARTRETGDVQLSRFYPHL